MFSDKTKLLSIENITSSIQRIISIMLLGINIKTEKVA